MSWGELGIVRSRASGGAAASVVSRAGGRADGFRVRTCGRAGADRPRAPVAPLRRHRLPARADRRRFAAIGVRDLLPPLGVGRAVAGGLPGTVSVTQAGGNGSPSAPPADE